MGIFASNNSTTRELIPAGNYIARAFSMIEIGTVNEQYMGESKIQKKVRIGWELPTELKVFSKENGEQPLVISKEYTLSMNEKSNLRKDLKSWRGKDFSEDEARSFDITKLLGAPCMLNIIHNQSKSDPTKVYEQISGITSVPKGMKVPPQINATVMLSYDNWNQDEFDRLPDFIKIKMQGSLEYTTMKNGQKNVVYSEPVSEVEDDLPF
jgi:hypothetical protein